MKLGSRVLGHACLMRGLTLQDLGLWVPWGNSQHLAEVTRLVMVTGTGWGEGAETLGAAVIAGGGTQMPALMLQGCAVLEGPAWAPPEKLRAWGGWVGRAEPGATCCGHRCPCDVK